MLTYDLAEIAAVAASCGFSVRAMSVSDGMRCS